MSNKPTETKSAITVPFFTQNGWLIRADVWTGQGYSSKTFAHDDKAGARAWIEELSKKEGAV